MKKLMLASSLIFIFSTIIIVPKSVKAQGELKKLCFISVEANNQGVIKGDATQKGREGKIVGYGYSYNVSSSKDATTGFAIGRKTQNGITVTKAIGISSPQLFQALSTNELLKKVTIEFWGPNPSASTGGSTEIKYYSLILSNAYISRINQYGGTNTTEKNLKTDIALEDVTFTFQKLEMSSTDGKSTTTAVDD